MHLPQSGTRCSKAWPHSQIKTLSLLEHIWRQIIVPVGCGGFRSTALADGEAVKVIHVKPISSQPVCSTS